MEHELRMLQARLDIMQKEVREVVSVMNADLHTVLERTFQAIQSLDARITALEAANASGKTSDKNTEGET